MADDKKYYYMRLKDNFFDSNEIALLESMQDGYLYSNILLKLYLRSLKDDGKLMFNNRIPYNPQMIATITRHQVGTVEKALSIFKEMGLIEILDNGAIYMLDIQQFIGQSSTEADRKKAYRRKIESEKFVAIPEKGQNVGQMSHQMSDKHPPEIRDKSIEYRDKNNKENNIKEKPNNKLFESEFELLYEIYPKKQGKANALKSYIKARKEGVTMEDIRQGIQNYLKYITITKKEDKYIKHASTWFNQQCWNDTYGSGKDAEPVYDTANNPKHTKEEYEELMKMLKKEEVN